MTQQLTVEVLKEVKEKPKAAAVKAKGELSAAQLSSLAPIDLASTAPKASAATDKSTSEAAPSETTTTETEVAAEAAAAGTKPDTEEAPKPTYGPVTVTLVEGTCEYFGAELVCGKEYVFAPGETCVLFTWTGCLLTVQGGLFTAGLFTRSHTAPTHAQTHKQQPHQTAEKEETPMAEFIKVHARLEEQRTASRQRPEVINGPRAVVCGNIDCGKSTLCRMLLNWAVRAGCTGDCSGRRPLFVDTDVGQNTLAIPGALAARVVEEVAPINTAEQQACLPEGAQLNLWFGTTSPSGNATLYMFLIDVLAAYCRQKMSADPLCLFTPTLSKHTKAHHHVTSCCGG